MHAGTSHPTQPFLGPWQDGEPCRQWGAVQQGRGELAFTNHSEPIGSPMKRSGTHLFQLGDNTKAGSSGSDDGLPDRMWVDPHGMGVASGSWTDPS